MPNIFVNWAYSSTNISTTAISPTDTAVDCRLPERDVLNSRLPGLSRLVQFYKLEYYPHNPIQLYFSQGKAFPSRITYATSEDSDQLVHPHSLIRAFTGTLSVSNAYKHLQADSEDSGQPVRTCSLVGDALPRSFNTATR